jgi:hypothetical protein
MPRNYKWTLDRVIHARDAGRTIAVFELNRLDPIPYIASG